jgi:hypothetical protein
MNDNNPLKKTLISISRHEWKNVFFISLLLIIITALPFAYGFFNQNSEYYYTGTHAFSPIDFNVYYSYINQVKDGHFLFHNLGNSDSNLRELTSLNILWLGVGFFAKIFNLRAPAALEIARSILILPLIAILYLWISYLFKDKLRRQIALIFSILATGLGGYALIISEIIAPNFLNRYTTNILGHLVYIKPMDLGCRKASPFLPCFNHHIS